ncbi:DUF1365 domain-containing protein [Solirhodobacter olei]|uniref:DUF1365 domain-containing protein n=1 Tax=Solirhodobacter olei TaxID=2493082 RepID=UPI000FD92F3B|nr:DUF1365 domain-containing protein [Solirhodobacter olei]
MSAWPEHVAGETTHARRGSIAHAFRYRTDYVLIDPETRQGPWLFSRNAVNLASVDDRCHGGVRGAGEGAAWARRALTEAGAPEGLSLRLLTQPRFLGVWFCPVSFWLAFEGAALRAVIAEVSNTFGERHSYLCAREGFEPIGPADRLAARKVFHVSPFQDVAGGYSFAFDITAARIAIRIALSDGPEGVIATLTGPRAPLTNRAILAAALRRPFGPLRTLALIYLNALRLRAKGAAYRARPLPPAHEVSR